MSLDTNFNVNPYYDDFDGTKKFLRTLFKPGYAVQARELTQLQTQLQSQIGKFGDHIFQNGSLVLGGQTALQDATYLTIETTYAGNTVDVNAFHNLTILSADESKRAEVILAIVAEGSDAPTLMVKQIYGSPFVATDVIKTDVADTTFATVSGVGTGQVFSINEGTFFYEGFFITNSAQIIATSKYDNTSADVRIGFEVTELIVSSSSDTSLLDPAQDASNYQAPGADRFKIDLVLSSRSLESTDDTQFIELARVENGKLIKVFKYPVYSVLEDTLARRTYDESGNYTVRPFTIALESNTANTAQTNVLLSPGKAYVFGYEFETTSTSSITAPKPRTSVSVQNKNVTADYGNYIFTTNHRGSFPIDNFATVDLHCVPAISINATSTANIANTKIGTARVKSIEYETTSSSSNTLTNVYRTYLFDAAIGSLTANVAAATANTITLPTLYSTVDNAYQGCKIRITTGPGSGEQVKMISSYVGSTRVATLESSFLTTPTTASIFSIDFELNDTDSIAVFSSTTPVANANIDIRSKDYSTPYVDAYLKDVANESQIFPLGENYITQGSIGDMTLYYRRLFKSQTFSGSATTFTLGSGEVITAASTESDINQNYYIAVTDKHTSTAYANGEIVRASNVSIDSGTATITVSGAGDMQANVIVTVRATNPAAKTKTYRTPNTTVQTGTTGDLINVFGNSAVNIYTTNCQTQIANTYVVKTPDIAQSLFVSDVVSLNTVMDFRGLNITQANLSSAVDITSRYALVNGQKDSYYDHAAIKLKPGQLPPSGPLLVTYNRFTSPDSGGFFSVDSYVNGGMAYGDIPKYISPTTGHEYQLRDCLDFRPVRADGSTTATFFSTNNPKTPRNGSDINMDYSYYLPRIDKVVLNRNRTFEVVQGIPSLTPKEPDDKTDAMTMFILSCPPYVSDTSQIGVQAIEHKRYTMRDIGALEKRISNLEYYTSLSQLEQTTMTKQDLTILDSQNLPRFKNGMIVDSFTGHSVADVFNTEYNASIDPQKKELRPTFNVASYSFNFDSNNSTNVSLTGPVLNLSYTNKSFINQPMASKSINVNPFNVINFLGKVKLEPSSDVWVDTNKKPDVVVNLGGEQDAWNRLLSGSGASNMQYEYGSWETKWTGTSDSVSREYEATFAYGVPRRILDRTVTTATGTSSRQVISSRVTTSTVTKNLGDRIVDMSVIPYMRGAGITVSGTGFKPDTTLYAFFDGKDVTKQMGTLNRFILDQAALPYKRLENITVRNATTNTSNGSAQILGVSNNSIWVHRVAISTGSTLNINPGGYIIGGTESGSANTKIVAYEHYLGGTSGGTTNTIVLSNYAAGANNISTWVGQPIYVYNSSQNHTGISYLDGQQGIISAYYPGNNTIRIAGTWNWTPASGDTYGIGNPFSTRQGDLNTYFYLPAGQFRTGEKRLLFVDQSTGDIASSSTNGDATFTSQGTLKTTEATIVSSVVPTIERSSYTQTQPASATLSVSAPRVVGYYDPLAQTFLVEPTNNPQGVFVTKVRLCFKTKDSTVPVTLQIRPTVNGYPSSSVVYPLATVSLNPDRVNTTTTPSLTDASKYTEFVFDSPVCLQPGEHSFVILANSKNYELYVGEIGKTDLVTSRQISDQPYGGSLFISQNGSTWTADQSSDIMFQVFVAEYTAQTGTAYFQVQAPSANVPFDLVRLGTTDSVVANTSITYQINSELATTGGQTGFQYITPNESISLEDGYGRRVLNKVANTTFNVKVTMATTNPSISPTIDTSRLNIITVENIINNMGLSNNDIIVTNGGSAYANVNNVSITFSGGGANATGAAATANIANGVIDRIFITNPGSGYTTSPTVTISTLAGPGSGATAVVNGEDKKSGGNGNVRYVTRRVTLNDGFDSSDFRVYLTAYLPQGANIYVYYKVLSKSDADSFDDKNYQLMTQLGDANFTSLSTSDYRELTFAPGTGGVANNAINYTTGTTAFNSFKTFAIKIVLAGTDTVAVPKIRDFRAIALPSGL